MTTAAQSLHNYLQGRKEVHLLSWSEASAGPADKVVWTVYCKIGGVVKGTGIGPQKADAKQAAAKQALENLGGA